MARGIADMEWRRNFIFLASIKIAMFGSQGNPYPMQSRIHLYVNSFVLIFQI